MSELLLTAPWARDAAQALRGGDFVIGLRVEHRWVHPDDRVEIHHQIYDVDGELRVWRLGEQSRADLRVVSNAPTGAQRERGVLHDSAARYVLRDGVERDVLGLPLASWKYTDFDLGDLDCRGLIVCGAGPDGLFQRRLCYHEQWLASRDATGEVTLDERGEVHTRVAKKEFRVNAPYGALLRWLHTDSILGHLIRAGFRVTGDLWRLSAIEGMLDATRRTYSCGQEQASIFWRYADVRANAMNAQATRNCLASLRHFGA